VEITQALWGGKERPEGHFREIQNTQDRIGDGKTEPARKPVELKGVPREAGTYSGRSSRHRAFRQTAINVLQFTAEASVIEDGAARR